MKTNPDNLKAFCCWYRGMASGKEPEMLPCGTATHIYSQLKTKGRVIEDIDHNIGVWIDVWNNRNPNKPVFKSDLYVLAKQYAASFSLHPNSPAS